MIFSFASTFLLLGFPSPAQASDPGVARAICLTATLSWNSTKSGEEKTFCADVSDLDQALCLFVTLPGVNPQNALHEKTLCADPKARAAEMCTQAVLQSKPKDKTPEQKASKAAALGACQQATEAQALCLEAAYPAPEASVPRRTEWTYCQDFAATSGKTAAVELDPALNACQNQLVDISNQIQKLDPRISPVVEALQRTVAPILSQTPGVPAPSGKAEDPATQ